MEHINQEHLNSTSLIRPKHVTQINRSYSEIKFFLKRPTTANWKAKLMQKKLESMQKTQTEFQILSQYREKIHENHSLYKLLLEERKESLEYNKSLQLKINICISEQQAIRRSNEVLHHDAIKYSKQSVSMINSESSLKKEKNELEKDIEKIQREIKEAEKIKESATAKYIEIYDKSVKVEKVVIELEKKISGMEAGKVAENENLRRTKKEIKRVNEEISKLQRVKPRRNL
jgi:chromosome segregation ATPase